MGWCMVGRSGFGKKNIKEKNTPPLMIKIHQKPRFQSAVNRQMYKRFSFMNYLHVGWDVNDLLTLIIVVEDALCR